MIKNDIRYIIKRVIIGILIILIMSLINNKIPKALETKTINLGSSNTTGYDSTGYGNFLFNNINFGSSFTKALNFTDVTIDNYDYLQFGIQLQYNQDNSYSETETEYQPVENTEYYCSSWVMKQQTYADGTQSNYYLCEKFSPSGQSSFYQNSTIGELQNIPQIGLMVDLVYNNNTVSPCEIKTNAQQNSIVECKLKSHLESIRFIRIRNMSNPYYNNIQGRIGIENYLFFWKDPINSSTNEIITNQNQNQQQNHQDMQEINNSINNSSVDNSNANSTIQTINNLIPTNNSVSSLISLPITLISSINNGISGSCTGIHLFTIYDYSFTLPCINLSEYLGVTWVIIDTIMSGMLVYAIAKTFIRVFSSLTEMDSNIIKEAYKE